MIVETKSEYEIKIIKKAARIVSDIISLTKQYIKVGISTLEIEKFIENGIEKFGCEPAFKGYRGYPACSCISIDDELVHGVPKKDKKIKKGQIVSIDIGIKYEGFYADAATTVIVGDENSNKQKNIYQLLDVTYKSIFEVLPYIKEGCKTGDIGYYIQRFVESYGYNVIREYVGHTIGRQLHEKPDIPNFGVKGEGVPLLSNTVICIEPMVSVGGWQTVVDNNDGWTVRMKDGSLCAHFEHMIIVRKSTAEVITDHNCIKPEIL